MKYLGDSYDIVKQALLEGLRFFGAWSVHPMLTEKATKEEIQTFEYLLGARVISTEVLTAATDRVAYLACTTQAGNLFLDPDTGLILKKTSTSRAPAYLFGTELTEIVSSRPQSLTLVFDQSLRRGKERDDLEQKLKNLQGHGIHSIAYVSHACFLICGSDRRLVAEAQSHIIAETRLPASRFLRTT